MDDMVKAALKKWPNVPACYSWLALDARGDWYMRDERIQAAGAFPHPKGSRINHDKLREFIHRNYEADAHGAWFFQNGPQRVYVELEAAPLILGVEPDGRGGHVWRTHAGAVVEPLPQPLLDEHGRLFLPVVGTLGLVRSLDMDTAADVLIAAGWEPQEVRFADLPARFGYCLRPQPAA